VLLRKRMSEMYVLCPIHEGLAEVRCKEVDQIDIKTVAALITTYMPCYLCMSYWKWHLTLRKINIYLLTMRHI